MPAQPMNHLFHRPCHMYNSDDGTPEFSGVGVWTPFLVPKQELESQELIPLRNQLLQRVDSP